MKNLTVFFALIACGSLVESGRAKKFPRHFKFATATSAYQIEGARNEPGQGLNVWDIMLRMNPDFVIDKANAEIACDSYHKYKEDVQLIKQLGLDVYRFSISWSRVLPKGTTDEINQAGVDYYHNLIDELVANGIEPMVTIYHWDLPQYFQNFGGWLNEDIIDHYVNYADFLFKTYGHKVKWWLTINEFYVSVLSYGGTSLAPAVNLHGTGEYLAVHNMLKAHAKAYRLYQSKYKYQNGKLSATVVGYSCLPKTESAEDIAAAERCNQFTYGWSLHPIFSKEGDYPQVMKAQVEKFSRLEGVPNRLPKFTQEEIEEIRGSYDFLALHYYIPKLASNGTDPDADIPSSQRDSETILGYDPSWPVEFSSGTYVEPRGLAELLRWVKKQCNDTPIFITEMGYVNRGGLEDDDRIEYLEKHFDVLKDAILIDKVNIIGLTVWSLLDTFEWNSGYSETLGLIHVDFNDPHRTRTLKKSALWYKKYITENRE